MQLTKVERWILSNQFRILEILCDDESEYYKTCRTAIENGYELHYGLLSTHIYDETLSAEECREVLDILTMFSTIKHSVSKLGGEAAELPFLEFRGFDGNNETAYMAYAEFFCNGQESPRYTDLNIQEFNSHSPTVAMYRRMLEVYEQNPPKMPDFVLSADVLKQISDAAIHPSN